MSRNVIETAIVPHKLVAPKHLQLVPMGGQEIQPASLGVVQTGKEEAVHNRQYQWVMCCASSQELRLQRHGALRKNPGYEVGDEWIDDAPQDVQVGTPMVVLGSGEIVAYLGPSSIPGDVNVRHVNTWEEFELPYDRLYPLPLQEPKIGEYGVPVGLGGMQHLNGKMGLVGTACKGGDRHWCQFLDPREDDEPPIQIQLNKQDLVTVPTDRVLTPWEIRNRRREERRLAMENGEEVPALTDQPSETDNSDGELHDEKDFQGPADEDETDFSDEDIELSTGCFLEFSDKMLASARLPKVVGERVFGILVQQRLGMGTEIRILNQHKHVIITEDSELAPISEMKLLDARVCHICKQGEPEESLILCEGPACMYAAHRGCGLHNPPEGDFYCDPCGKNLRALEKGMRISYERDGHLVTAKIVSADGPVGKRTITAELFSDERDDAIIVMAADSIPTETVEEKCITRFIAPGMEVYVDMPANDALNGLTGIVRNWLDEPTNKWIVEIEGRNMALVEPEDLMPVLCIGMRASSEGTMMELMDWCDSDNKWLCRRVDDDVKLECASSDLRCELAPGMAARDLTNGALVEVFMWDVKDRVFACKPLSKPDWSGCLALVDGSQPEGSDWIFRAPRLLECLHRVGDIVKACLDPKYIDKVWQIDSWDYLKGMWKVSERTHRKRKIKEHAFIGCTGLEKCADIPGAAPYRPRQQAPEGVQPLKNSHRAWITVDGAIVNGPQRPQEKDAEADIAKMKAIQEDLDHLKEWIAEQKKEQSRTQQKTKLLEQSLAGKSKMRDDSDDEVLRDPVTNYSGPWTLEELSALPIKDLRQKGHLVGITDRDCSGMDKNEVAKMVFEKMPEKPSKNGPIKLVTATGRVKRQEILPVPMPKKQKPEPVKVGLRPGEKLKPGYKLLANGNVMAPNGQVMKRAGAKAPAKPPADFARPADPTPKSKPKPKAKRQSNPKTNPVAPVDIGKISGVVTIDRSANGFSAPEPVARVVKVAGAPKPKKPKN